MTQAPDTPAAEPVRQRAVDRLALEDWSDSEDAARVSRLAAALLGTPMATVSIVDRELQRFFGGLGLDVSQTSREVSFCGHTILQTEPMVVEDAQTDPRFAQNPLVTGEPHIRFYAGAPVRNANGLALGALCVLDQKPHKLTDDQLARLQDLAGLIETSLTLRARAVTDALTGLFNGQQFKATLARVCADSERGNTSVAKLSIDGFRPRIEVRGAAEADELLCVLAAMIEAAAAGKRGTAFRTGLDEFALLLPDTDAQATIGLISRMREQFRTVSFGEDATRLRPLSFSAAIGKCCDGDHTPATSIRALNAALQTAKQEGGNCTRSA